MVWLGAWLVMPVSSAEGVRLIASACKFEISPAPKNATRRGLELFERIEDSKRTDRWATPVSSVFGIITEKLRQKNFITDMTDTDTVV